MGTSGSQKIRTRSFDACQQAIMLDDCGQLSIYIVGCSLIREQGNIERSYNSSVLQKLSLRLELKPFLKPTKKFWKTNRASRK
jgi:hypothetical protein